MTERFYSIHHLSAEQLRELYVACRPRGWVDAHYHELKPAGVYPPELPETEILRNINAEDENNYFVFMLDHEDEEDGVMIGFGMKYHPDFAVYLHLPPGLLDELVEKYALHVSGEGKEYSEIDCLIDRRLKNSLN
jgi:hypothetical protein